MTLVRMETNHVLGLPTTSGDPSPFTAYGVYKGIKACLKEEFGSAKLEGIKIAVSGVGHVGSSLCEMLAKEGAILTISDIDEESFNLLKLGEIIGVGKQTVFGLGKISIGAVR
jgi:leucine dehydrogenase